ncbi:hypothetical protein [Aquisphaera insulae]|uniref:hypothetical protein n=1 Tax=Aquisphaera insulae TaxID=2712864 RepID=UPI0013EB52D3|nr:hypothetical protein [Aquisphaera insulae]
MGATTSLRVQTVALVFLAGWPGIVSSAGARDEDTIVISSVSALKLEPGGLIPAESKRPTTPASVNLGYRCQPEEMPYVVLDGPGEAYVGVSWPQGRTIPEPGGTWPLSPLGHLYGDDVVAARVPASPDRREIRGRIVFPGEKGMTSASFVLPIRKTTDESKRAFGISKRSYFECLLYQGGPGAPWFLRQIAAARDVLGEPHSDAARVRRIPNTSDLRFRARSMEDTFSLFGGGRAIDENLQLDRPLPLTGNGDDPDEAPQAGRVPRPTATGPVKIDSLTGITVAEIDWKHRLQGRTPSLDPLARAIPADQHALFIANLDAADNLLRLLRDRAFPLLGTAGRADEALPVQQRYERQLGVTVDEILLFQKKVAGDRAIRSLAISGSDPYLATGTDLALIFEVTDPSALVDFLKGRIEAAGRHVDPAVHIVEEVCEGGKVRVARSSDRSLSAFLASWDDLVLLTNSRWQVQQVGKTIAGKLPRLADAPEYTFFRDRYPRGGEDENGLIVLTDAAIRRWCGPKWRIGSSRRLRAAGRLVSLQANHMAEIAGDTAKGLPLQANRASHAIDLGGLSLTRGGVLSQVYGTLANPTPIADLPLEEATAEEAAGYKLWRDGYQRNLRQYFDPIAIRLGGRPDRSIAMDLSVMPLIASSEYREFIDLVGASKIGPGDGDPHPSSLLHGILAIDIKAAIAQNMGNDVTRLTQMPPQIALGWIGASVSLFLDDDPTWRESLGTPPSLERAIEHPEKIPAGLQIASTDGTKLALFLAAARAYLDQSAPGMLNFEVRKHGQRDYVHVGMKDGAGGGPASGMTLYYAATPRALVISPVEKVVLRFLDRLDAKSAGNEPKPSPTGPEPAWLGESLALKLDPAVIPILSTLGSPTILERLRLQSWANLPILNEYHRLFPDRDPLLLHETLWGTRLTCPGGGRYVWNDTWKTMESTAFGCPAAPRTEQASGLATASRDLKSLRFGLTFEDQGLRARVAIDLKQQP